LENEHHFHTITYNAFNKISTIELLNEDFEMSFTYGPTRHRRQVNLNNRNSKTSINRYYMPGLYK
ncbi:MAG: hypothetical protein FWE63_07125, partial [Bacteroidales bacterium]|nr:hypothetical protein [Bacteroidales bacterium]